MLRADVLNPELRAPREAIIAVKMTMGLRLLFLESICKGVI
jgi:hypothetical protein